VFTHNQKLHIKNIPEPEPQKEWMLPFFDRIRMSEVSHNPGPAVAHIDDVVDLGQLMLKLCQSWSPITKYMFQLLLRNMLMLIMQLLACLSLM
jgi:hypothetical protein